MKFNQWFLFLLCFFISSMMSAQSLTYQVYFKDDLIGKLFIKKTTVGSVTDFNVDSRIKVDKVITMEIIYKILAHFENNKLVRSSVYQTNNGRVHTNSTTVLQKNVYKVNTLESKKQVKEVIDYNLCTLYYQEPITHKKIWSDSFGQFIPVKFLAAHKYQLTLPDGKQSVYIYEGGICTRVITEQLFSEVTFRLVK